MDNENSGFKEMFAFYNVENLLLPDPPPLHKSNPTMSGLRNWDERKYRLKLSKIAYVFQLLRESEGGMPALIGLCEIHGSRPLADLVAKDVFQQYRTVHYASSNVRAIDVALLYDPLKLELLSSKPIKLNFNVKRNGISAEDSVRDILHCKFAFFGTVLNVFVLHLPSQREKDINKNVREGITEALRETVINKIPADEAVAVLGDFNANPDTDAVKKLIYGEGSGKKLCNPFLGIFRQHRFSLYHHGNGLLFDQIILSEEFYCSDFPIKFSEAKIFNHEKLRVRDRKFPARPARTFAGTRYLGGYSDHFPIIAKFRNTKIT